MFEDEISNWLNGLGRPELGFDQSGYGSYIRLDGKNLMWFVGREHWDYYYLYLPSDDEESELRNKLSDPRSIHVIESGKVRSFRVHSLQDIEVVRQIVVNRLSRS